jgi:Iron-containing redox enzyme
MQSTIANQSTKRIKPILLESPNSQAVNYHQAERQFDRLLMVENLDSRVKLNPDLIKDFEVAIASASRNIFGDVFGNKTNDFEIVSRFIQRILYRINRLNLFWYDDLRNYENERSVYLHSVRERLESTWQTWELSQLNADLDPKVLNQLDSDRVKQALQQLADRDLNPPLSEPKHYIRKQMDLEGYRLLLAIASLDGLVEASRLSRILGGASNEIQATLFRVLLEEYGNGRLARKHSTFFSQMLDEMGLKTSPETYFYHVPWQVLASINHNFLLTERKRHFLRYNGGLTYFEIAGPSIYTDYMIAAERLQLSGTAMGYWKLHIREDERHGQWMLTEVAFPLADKYPKQAWELVLGYEQEKFMGDRAAAAVMALIKQSIPKGE